MLYNIYEIGGSNMALDEFKTVAELYQKVLPALKNKKKEFAINKIYFVKEKDIWQCLLETKWQYASNLTLFDIVNDILTLREEDLLNYLQKKRENL